MSKNILLVSHDNSVSGGPLVLQQLARGLEDRDYNTLVVTKDHYQATKEYLGWWDLVICNTLLTYQTVLDCHGLGIPVLWWLHEGRWMREQLWQHQMKQALWVSTANVVSSVYLKKLYEHVLEKTFLIPYVVPETPEPVYNRDHPIRFLMAGSIEWRKGQDIAVAAFKELVREHPQARLTIIGGPWNTPYAQQILEQVVGIPQVSVYLTMPPSKFQEILREHDVVLCPSRDEGGYPQVLLQAQEMGKVVIASDCSGMKEQVHHGINGFISSNTEWYYWMSNLFMGHRGWQEDMGQQAREGTHKNNRLDTHLDQWVELIERHISVDLGQ